MRFVKTSHRAAMRSFQQMSRAHSFITQIEHLERSVKGALAADLAANLSFGENL